MGFLDRIYFDNSIRSYLMVAGAILVVFIFKRILSRYLAVLLFKVAKRIWKIQDKKIFVVLIIEPLEWVWIVLVTVFSLDKLHFPKVLKFDIYEHATNDIISRIGTAIIIISFVWLLLRLIDFAALILNQQAFQLNDSKDSQLVIFFSDFLKVIIGIAGLLLIIKACFNQHIGNLLTGLSLVGAALALAAKESLENLIASFIIFFDRPFFIDDVVKANDITGVVERIGLRSTRIRTADKTLVTMPNKQMVDSIVDNLSMRTQRRAEIKLELSPTTNQALVKTLVSLLKNLLEENKQHILSSSVFLKEYNKNCLLVTVEYFTEPFTQKEFDKLKENINFSAKKIIEDNKIEMAGETNTININEKTP